MIIYKATNLINNKSYIGQTVKSLSQRASEHKHRALYEQDYHNKFHNAIRKYGFENFKWEILDSSDKWTFQEMDEKEQLYIKEYNTIQEGYNTLEGGQGNSRIDSEEMAKIRGSKPFLAFNIKGEFIGEFINKTAFARQYNITVQRICEMIKGTALSANKIIVIDKEKYTKKILEDRLKKCVKKQPFMAINLKTQKITGPYTNIEECKRILQLPKNCHITEVLKKTRKTSNGYSFYYI